MKTNSFSKGFAWCLLAASKRNCRCPKGGGGGAQDEHTSPTSTSLAFFIPIPPSSCSETLQNVYPYKKGGSPFRHTTIIPVDRSISTITNWRHVAPPPNRVKRASETNINIYIYILRRVISCRNTGRGHPLCLCSNVSFVGSTVCTTSTNISTAVLLRRIHA